MRALWTGALTFGLINIPVKLYAASKEHGGISFDYLHKEDLSPIQYIRVCQADGREISFDEVVRGYQYKKGDYVVLSEEDFQRADPHKTHAVEILDFTQIEEIDPVYYERPFFVEPQKGAEKPYVLLREALRRSRKIGIVRFVLRGREHLGAISAESSMIILHQLRFRSDIRAPDDLVIPERHVDEKEMEMALALIDTLSEPFHPEEYRDTYTEELKRVIDEKVHGKKEVRRPKEPRKTDMRDLVKLLRESLESAARRKSPKHAGKDHSLAKGIPPVRHEISES